MEIELTSGTKAKLVKNPSGATDRGLVIIPDVMGLRPLFDELANKLADDWNTTVCVFDVFAEQTFPDVEDHETNLQNHYTAVTQLQDSRIVSDAVASAEAIRGELSGEGVKIGVTGFCMGGMYTLKTMALTAEGGGNGPFHRGAAFYPQIKVPENWRGSGQGEPLDLITPESAKRTFAVIGTEDHYTPPDDVKALEATGMEIVIFEGCDHGFVHDPYRPAHRPEEAKQSLAKAEQFIFAD